MDEPHHCRLYNWLVQSDTISNCKSQVDASKVLHRLVIEVDSIALLEFDSYLGNCLIGNYQLFCQLIQEVLFEVLQESIESKNQLLCIVRPTPTITNDTSDDSLMNSSALVNLWGQIVAVKDAVSYTQSTKYKCPDETCSGADDSAHIRVYTLKSRECDVINPSLRCMYCGETLYEDVSRRALGRRISAAFHVYRENEGCYHVDYTTNLIVRDELISRVILGSKISVVGLQLSKLNPSSCTVLTTIEVVNIEPVSHPLPHLIPHSLRDVYSVREQSPWQLINLLAFCVTPEYLPQGSYHALKQSLSCGTHLCGSREGVTLQMGPLLSAADGVALVGDIEVMRKETRSDLSIVLQNRAAISGKKKSEIFPLRSVVWGFQSADSKHFPAAWDVIYRVSKDFDDEATIQSILYEKSSSILPEDDVKAYITLSSNIEVEFDESCSRLIAGYCQASKSVRYGCGYELPINSAYTLHLLAGNHARINFRKQALDVDAVIAIKLYEECLFCYQRYSTVNLKLQTHVNPGEEDVYLGCNVDTEMEDFYTKLVQFCTTHIPGFEVSNED